ncbi:MAG: carbamoyltransferase HypF [Rhodobacteraceae bacterium]|nr:carbamoyltransferase HypF [Paracoccaceae bacterium]
MSGAQEIRVRGLVQGVGFRPRVWHLAQQAGLVGEVLNDGGGVLIRLRAGGEALMQALHENSPPLARIDALELRVYTGPLPESGFHIVASAGGAARTGISPDAATCPDCLAEVNDPHNRRHRYAFTNCTNCGPRLSITRAIPYDRAHTTMAAFPMCPACQAEYADPANRRYHAQPNACPDCGPQLALVDATGQPLSGDPLAQAAALIKAGKIVAIKGLGGFQLAADASNEAAVSHLRARKRRPGKPLALMLRDMDMAAKTVALDAPARALLQNWQAPIVLLARIGKVAPSVAPGQPRLGVMLPNTPLHHILMQALDHPLVLTSGNVSGDPQIIDNSEALQKLGCIADYFLLHNRDIANRMDDSVVQMAGNTPQTLRRARGYAPAPLQLHKGFADLPPALAMGADLKNTFCLLKNGQAIVSQHMGDMKSPQTQRDVRHNLALYQKMYDFIPVRVAVDMHPGYFSTRLGQKMGEVVPVQHHHAHIAAVMAEHGLPPNAGPVLGVVLDGLGYGADGTIWGGEFLLADFRQFKRLAHFPPIALPGGDKANTQPWRNLFAHLRAAFGPDADLREQFGPLPVLDRLEAKPLQMLGQMIDQNLNSPVASSAGRLFDAVAAALGLCFERQTYEGEAAMQLQAMAETCTSETGTYLIYTGKGLTWEKLWSGIFYDISNGVATGRIARRFHNALVQGIVRNTLAIAEDKNLQTVVLSGGVMQNRLLFSETRRLLQASGVAVLSPVHYPANDGGISLGQATIASASMQAS